MRAEEFDKASIEELQAHANVCFDMAQSPRQEPLVMRPGARPFDLSDEAKLRLLLEAQFYMTAVARKRDEQVAKRDFRMEVAVIVLIGAEIVLSLIGIYTGIHEANQQSNVLSSIEKSTKDSASAMSAASTSLKMLADQQTASVNQLQQMNSSLQDSSTKTRVMASSSQKQLQILQDEQATRQAQLARKPKLEIYVSSILLKPGDILPAKARQSTDDRSIYDVVLRNSGDAIAMKGTLRVIVSGKGTWLESTSGALRPYEQADSETHTYLIPFEYLRPNVQIPFSFTIGYPKDQQLAIAVNFNTDVDELPAAMPLGTLIVVPPTKSSN